MVGHVTRVCHVCLGLLYMMSDEPSTSSSFSGLSSGLEDGAPAAKRQRTLSRDWKLIDSQRSFNPLGPILRHQ